MADDRPHPDDLDRRIAAAKAEVEDHSVAQDPAAESRGWAVGIEFVGTVLASALLGWLLDRYLIKATVPWGLIVLMLLGFAAGTRRALQTSRQFDADPKR